MNKSKKSKKAKKAKAGKDNSVGNKRILRRSDVEYDCGKQLYILSFVGIGQHLMAVAKAKCAGPSKKCEICPTVLAFHQGSYQDNDNSYHVQKEMFEGSEDELSNHDSLDVGVFPLENIFGAFEKAKSDNTVYDLVSHNCASLLIEMFLELGIDPTDKSIVIYASNHLFDNANSFMMDELSQNDFRLALEDNANLEEDQYAIIEDFVKAYIDEQV
jgi:hypothetical protein